MTTPSLQRIPPEKATTGHNLVDEELAAARDVADRLKAQARRELADARARSVRLSQREKELDARFEVLRELEERARSQISPVVDQKSQPDVTGPSAAVAAAADQLVAEARIEATRLREEAMRLLALAEDEKATAHERAIIQTELVAAEAQETRRRAAQEAERIRAASTAASPDDGNRYSAGARKLPRLGERATSLLSEMSSLRARIAEDPPEPAGG